MHRHVMAVFDAALLFSSVYSDNAASNSTGSSPGNASGKAARVNVFVMAPLKESLGEMEKKFESAHLGIDLVFSFADSQELVEQINSSAPADAVATTNTAMMDVLKSGGRVVDTKVFALNILVLITPKENPTRVTGLNLSLDKAKLVIRTPRASAGDKTVPCGIATAELVRKLGMKFSPVSEGQKVTDVRNKVMSGEVDAGTVYRTDTVAGGKKAETIEIPGADTIVNDYPVRVIKASKNSSRAKTFTEYVTSREGQMTLKKHGFNEVGAGRR